MKKKMKKSQPPVGQVTNIMLRPEGIKMEGKLFTEDMVKEAVNHPSHYNSGKIEVWDFIIDQGLTYCLGDAVKYISRAGKKDSNTAVQDLKKAVAFINREIQRIETGA